MKSDLLALGMFQNEVQPRSDVGRVQRRALLDRRWEHPPGVYALLVLFQNGQERRRQTDCADGGLRFGLGDQEPVLLCSVDLLGDLQLSSFQVQVIPLESQQFSLPQASGQLQQEQLEVPLRLGLDQKPLDLLTGQHLHFAGFLGRQFAADGGIHTDQSLLHRLLQRGPAVHMAGPHHAVGQPLAVVFRVEEAPALFQSGVELLQVVLCQLIEGDTT